MDYFVEYDVEKDAATRGRMLDLTGGTRTVPVMAEEGTTPDRLDGPGLQV